MHTYDDAVALFDPFLLSPRLPLHRGFAWGMATVGMASVKVWMCQPLRLAGRFGLLQGVRFWGVELGSGGYTRRFAACIQDWTRFGYSFLLPGFGFFLGSGSAAALCIRPEVSGFAVLALGIPSRGPSPDFYIPREPNTP